MPAPKRSTRGAKKDLEARASRSAGARGGRLWENVKSFAGALAIFLIIRTFLLEAYQIPSESMVPSLLVGDWLFVNKLRYGPHLPFTKVNLPGYAEPRRNDVAVFQSPPQPDELAFGRSPTPTLVKRIAGQPGDTLYMRNDTLYVNGERENRSWVITGAGDGRSEYPEEAFLWQKQYEVAGTRFGPPPARATLGTWGPIVVPPKHYFMLGDNRHQSKDSRYWGLVPRANYRGRPLFVYYSYNRVDSDRAMPFLTDIRWSRIGHVIR